MRNLLFIFSLLAMVIENTSSEDVIQEIPVPGESKVVDIPIAITERIENGREAEKESFDDVTVHAPETHRLEPSIEEEKPLQTTGVPANEEVTLESPPTTSDDINSTLTTETDNDTYTDQIEKGMNKDEQVNQKVNEFKHGATLAGISENYLDKDNTSSLTAEGRVHNSYSHPHDHGHGHGTYHGQGGHSHVHAHNNNYHTSNVKPLKQSIVHRDPVEHYDVYDAIRTQDYDQQSHRHQRIHPNSHQSSYGNGHTHGHKNSHGHSHGSYGNFQPYHYDTHHVPQCVRQSSHYQNITFCLEDHYYPTETILWAISHSSHYAHRLLSDVTYQSADNLVDDLTREEEERMTYSHYYGGSQQRHHQLEKYTPPYKGYSYNQEYYKNGGYICPSDIYYARPRRAINTYGKWKVIVNLDHLPKGTQAHTHGHVTNHHHQTFTQTLRLEQCIYPNSPCSYIDSHYHSRCLQKHNFVRLVAWTYDDGLHIDTFKLPIACSCHIQQPSHYYAPKPHQHNHHQTSAYGHGHKQVVVGLHHGKAKLLDSILG